MVFLLKERRTQVLRASPISIKRLRRSRPFCISYNLHHIWSQTEQSLKCLHHAPEARFQSNFSKAPSAYPTLTKPINIRSIYGPK